MLCGGRLKWLLLLLWCGLLGDNHWHWNGDPCARVGLLLRLKRPIGGQSQCGGSPRGSCKKLLTQVTWRSNSRARLSRITMVKMKL